MPIEGRHLREVSQILREHLNVLLSHTITRVPLIAYFDRGSTFTQLSFRHGGVPSTITLHTKFGSVDLFLAQMCDAIEGQHHRVQLRTTKYRYTLTPAGASEPAFRWEYEKFPSASSFWCRHHLQGPLPFQFGHSPTITLNDLHLPTGWVTIEEVIRVCIVDLGVTPLETALENNGVPAWHARLQDSYERFKNEFLTP
jgi:hypothetical protein